MALTKTTTNDKIEVLQLAAGYPRGTATGTIVEEPETKRSVRLA